MRIGIAWLSVLVLFCTPAITTTVALIRTPQEIFVAADSAVEGKREAVFCEIRQLDGIFFAVEGVAEINAVTDRKPDPAKSFHVKQIAEHAAKRPGTIAEKALRFEHETEPAFQKVVTQNKNDAPEGYRRYLSGRPQALQVIFFGIDPDHVPAYALVTFGVKDNAHGEPTITVERRFCPGKDCYEPADISILGESQKAMELTKQLGFPGSDLAGAARRLVEAEIRDKPTLVKPPVDVVQISILGSSWISVKPQCVNRAGKWLQRGPPLLPGFGRSGKLFSLNPDVAELAEVLIEAGDWQIFRHGCGGDQAVHKMGLCSFEAVESV